MKDGILDQHCVHAADEFNPIHVVYLSASIDRTDKDVPSRPNRQI